MCKVMLKHKQPLSVNKSSRQGGEARAEKKMDLGGSDGMVGAHAERPGKGVKGGKWAFFREQGLFTLTAAHESLVQSQCGPH